MNGIFITAELEGDVGAQLHALQERFDPKMARALPPHITITGSSGVGPLPPDLPILELRAKILPIASATVPMTLRFGLPERFVGRNIVSLRLDPHGPLRELHDRLRTSGLPFAPARYAFTPHCTLNLFPELTQKSLKAMLAVRVEDPFTVHRLRVYLTRDPQPPTLLLEAPLGG